MLEQVPLQVHVTPENIGYLQTSGIPPPGPVRGAASTRRRPAAAL